MLGEAFTTCNGALGIMKPGDTCTLPDGSNIGVWNGSSLTNPAGGSIDTPNGTALVQMGWPAAQVAGQGTPWATIAAVVVGGIGILLLASVLIGGKKSAPSLAPATTPPTETTP